MFDEEVTWTHVRINREQLSANLPHVVAISGPETGRVLPICGELVIGRGTEAGLRIDHRAVSRRHVILSADAEGGVVLKDLGSRNGTRVNGGRVSTTRLSHGDRIDVGGACTLLFSEPTSRDGSSVPAKPPMSQLAAAHDFNHMLCTITTSIFSLDLLPPDASLESPSVQKFLRSSVKAAQQAANLTNELFGLGGGAEFGPVDLGATVQQVAETIQGALPASVRLSVRVRPGVVAHGNGDHLIRVFTNLCLNARDAMPRGGTLALHVRRAQRGQLRKVGLCGEYALVVVRDSGVGMDTQTRERVFEPGFSSKGKERGLGLPLVRNIVLKHGGDIRVSSAPNRGTEFQVFLPLASAQRSELQ